MRTLPMERFELMPPVQRKATTKVSRTFNIPTIQQYIDTAFGIQLQIFHKSGMQLNTGDAVLARMRGYEPWPARILGFKNNNKIIKCYFFGANNIGQVGTKQVIPFADAFETVRIICIRNPPNFIKGIREIEVEFGVSDEFSCLKEHKSIE